MTLTASAVGGEPATVTETADFTVNAESAIELLGGSERVEYDEVSNEITFNGVDFSTSANVAVKLPDGVKLVLENDTENCIISTYVGDSGTSYGIESGDLTIYGEGSLEVISGISSISSQGISASSLTISGGELTATGGEAKSSIGIAGNSITISGGEVTATGGRTTEPDGKGMSVAIFANDFLEISSGTVTATGGEAPISCGISARSVTISGGESTVTSADVDIMSCAIYAESSVTISEGTVTVISGIVTDPSGMSIAITVLEGSIEITGGTVTAIGHTQALFSVPVLNAYSDCFAIAATSTNGGDPVDPENYNADKNADYEYFKIKLLTTVTTAEVTGITAPVTGVVPVGAEILTGGHASYTVTELTWQNSDDSAATLTEEGRFNAATTYQAVIELTAAAGYKFQALTPTVDAGAAEAGTIDTGGEGNKLTFTVTFNPTAVLQVTGIAVITQPTKLSYTEEMDGILALNGMVVTETNNDGSTATVIFTDGTSAGYTTDPANGTALTMAAHNNFAVSVTHIASGLTAQTDNLVVNTAPPAQPGAPTDVSAIAGNGQAEVSFTPPVDNGGSTITGYTVTSNPGNITVAGTSTTITVTGLSNGTIYTFAVTASNIAGTSPASEASNAVTPYRPSSGNPDRDSHKSSAPSKPLTPPVVNTGVDILVNGKTETAATAITTQEGDKTATTVVVDDKKVEERLEQEGNNAVVTIPVMSGADVVIGTLNGQTVKNMESQDAVLEIKTGQVIYTLPASQINIDAISGQIGKPVALQDIEVSVKISEPAEDTVKIVEDTADKRNYQIMVKPIEFEITCSNGNKTVEVSKFNAYVERLIAIPEGVDPSRITTGIIVNADGTLSHVPTVITIIDGKYYAKINSLTNSVYLVIYSPKTFKDTENHWAKEEIDDMASRLVVSGVGEDKFEPNRDITRAEFASIAIRALGLMRPETGKDVFNDVPKDAWYYNAVAIAYEYDLIAGYGSGQFGPMDKITREQAMTMVARAMKITGLEAGMTDSEVSKVLAGFTDANSTADYAKTSIVNCVKTGIVSGRSETSLAPKDNITRAEVTVIVRRLLQQSGLI